MFENITYPLNRRIQSAVEQIDSNWVAPPSGYSRRRLAMTTREYNLRKRASRCLYWLFHLDQFLEWERSEYKKTAAYRRFTDQVNAHQMG